MSRRHYYIKCFVILVSYFYTIKVVTNRGFLIIFSYNTVKFWKLKYKESMHLRILQSKTFYGLQVAYFKKIYILFYFYHKNHWQGNSRY